MGDYLYMPLKEDGIPIMPTPRDMSAVNPYCCKLKRDHKVKVCTTERDFFMPPMDPWRMKYFPSYQSHPLDMNLYFAPTQLPTSKSPFFNPPLTYRPISMRRGPNDCPELYTPNPTLWKKKSADTVIPSPGKKTNIKSESIMTVKKEVQDTRSVPATTETYDKSMKEKSASMGDLNLSQNRLKSKDKSDASVGYRDNIVQPMIIGDVEMSKSKKSSRTSVLQTEKDEKSTRKSKNFSSLPNQKPSEAGSKQPIGPIIGPGIRREPRGRRNVALDADKTEKSTSSTFGGNISSSRNQNLPKKEYKQKEKEDKMSSTSVINIQSKKQKDKISRSKSDNKSPLTSQLQLAQDNDEKSKNYTDYYKNDKDMKELLVITTNEEDNYKNKSKKSNKQSPLVKPTTQDDIPEALPDSEVGPKFIFKKQMDTVRTEEVKSQKKSRKSLTVDDTTIPVVDDTEIPSGFASGVDLKPAKQKIDKDVQSIASIQEDKSKKKSKKTDKQQGITSDSKSLFEEVGGDSSQPDLVSQGMPTSTKKKNKLGTNLKDGIADDEVVDGGNEEKKSKKDNKKKSVTGADKSLGEELGGDKSQPGLDSQGKTTLKKNKNKMDKEFKDGAADGELVDKAKKKSKKSLALDDNLIAQDDGIQPAPASSGNIKSKDKTKKDKSLNKPTAEESNKPGAQGQKLEKSRKMQKKGAVPPAGKGGLNCRDPNCPMVKKKLKDKTKKQNLLKDQSVGVYEEDDKEKKLIVEPKQATPTFIYSPMSVNSVPSSTTDGWSSVPPSSRNEQEDIAVSDNMTQSAPPEQTNADEIASDSMKKSSKKNRKAKSKLNAENTSSPTSVPSDDFAELNQDKTTKGKKIKKDKGKSMESIDSEDKLKKKESKAKKGKKASDAAINPNEMSAEYTILPVTAPSLPGNTDGEVDQEKTKSKMSKKDKRKSLQSIGKKNKLKKRESKSKQGKRASVAFTQNDTSAEPTTLPMEDSSVPGSTDGYTTDGDVGQGKTKRKKSKKDKRKSLQSIDSGKKMKKRESRSKKGKRASVAFIQNNISAEPTTSPMVDSSVPESTDGYTTDGDVDQGKTKRKMSKKDKRKSLQSIGKKDKLKKRESKSKKGKRASAAFIQNDISAEPTTSPMVDSSVPGSTDGVDQEKTKRKKSKKDKRKSLQSIDSGKKMKKRESKSKKGKRASVAVIQDAEYTTLPMVTSSAPGSTDDFRTDTDQNKDTDKKKKSNKNEDSKREIGKRKSVQFGVYELNADNNLIPVEQELDATESNANLEQGVDEKTSKDKKSKKGRKKSTESIESSKNLKRRDSRSNKENKQPVVSAIYESDTDNNTTVALAPDNIATTADPEQETSKGKKSKKDKRKSIESIDSSKRSKKNKEKEPKKGKKDSITDENIKSTDSAQDVKSKKKQKAEKKKKGEKSDVLQQKRQSKDVGEQFSSNALSPEIGSQFPSCDDIGPSSLQTGSSKGIRQGSSSQTKIVPKKSTSGGGRYNEESISQLDKEDMDRDALRLEKRICSNYKILHRSLKYHDYHVEITSTNDVEEFRLGRLLKHKERSSSYADFASRRQNGKAEGF